MKLRPTAAKCTFFDCNILFSYSSTSAFRVCVMFNRLRSYLCSWSSLEDFFSFSFILSYKLLFAIPNAGLIEKDYIVE